MKINAFTFNPFGVMTYVLWDSDSRQATIVDPGMTEASERDALAKFIESKQLTVKYIINTHMHLDHIFGDNWAREHFEAELWAASADGFLGAKLSEQARRFGLRISLDPVVADHELHDGDRLTLGSETLEVIAVPGHSPGSVALYCPESGFVIVGDTLFKGSVGRTDLEGGDLAALTRSIRTRLYRLPDDTIVCPGHGPTTTIGSEKSHNPFV